jgi:hypothetical protein
MSDGVIRLQDSLPLSLLPVFLCWFNSIALFTGQQHLIALQIVETARTTAAKHKFLGACTALLQRIDV